MTQEEKGPASRRWVAGYPNLVREWHPSRNGILTPDQVSFGSGRRVWWRCSLGPDHEWRAVVQGRTTGQHGCPFCANQRVSVTNSLHTRFPDVARQWHPRLNAPLTAAGVVWGATRRVWWKCPAGRDHVWQASVSARTFSGTGCPYCDGRRVSVTNSLLTQAPLLAAQWHPTRNRTLRPSDLACGSTRLVWWQCPLAPDHAWRVSVGQRISHHCGCPFCAGKQISQTNALSVQAPDVAREWHPDRNGDLTPGDVTYGSPRRVWWKCSEGHEWVATILNRARKQSGCPHCVRHQRRG